MLFLLNFRLSNILVQYRRTLFSLATLRIGNFEPIYLKLVKCTDSVQDVGTICLVEYENDLELIENIGNLISIEIYHDRDELELICAGKSAELELAPIRNNNSNNEVFPLDLGSMEKKLQSHITIPLFHNSQGKFVIRAGTIDLDIEAYAVNVEQYRDEQFTRNPKYSCQICHPKSFKVQTPPTPPPAPSQPPPHSTPLKPPTPTIFPHPTTPYTMKSMDVFSPPLQRTDLMATTAEPTEEEDDDDDEEEDSIFVRMMRKDEEEESDDADSVDEFVASFLSRASTVRDSQSTGNMLPVLRRSVTIVDNSMMSLPAPPRTPSRTISSALPIPPPRRPTGKKQPVKSKQKKSSTPHYMQTTKAFDSQRLDKFW